MQIEAAGPGQRGEVVARNIDRDTQRMLKMTKEGMRECVASNEMCTFLILNILSLSLIPVNMIVYR